VVADLGTKLKHTSGKKNLVVIWMPVLAFWVFLFFRKMVSSIVKTPSCKKEVYEHTKVLPDHLSEHKNKGFCHHPNTLLCEHCRVSTIHSLKHIATKHE
jgi:hypothetical protein